ncbi:2Fe-2S ferredoxin [Massilia sp. WF1]|uniref:ISC system 2Fe-2S type ferredoxin n=1 Tax=Massilia sp. WF1 TaxID=1406431 RepID=UPI00064A25F0|nr:2Fe-2S ferredoxin [Massilia sp. WF1]
MPPQILVFCPPEGASWLVTAAGQVDLRHPAGLENDIEIEHACDRVCACTTCHVIVREGFDSLNEQEEKEEDMLDKAWGLEPNSRLSCQAIIADEDLVVEIPKYTINHAAENH